MMHILAAYNLAYSEGTPPIFKNSDDLHSTIDECSYGESTWTTLKFRYNGPVDEHSAPWKQQEYFVHARNALRIVEWMAGNPDFHGKWDYVPFRDSHLMSGQWAWQQAVSLVADWLVRRLLIYVQDKISDDETIDSCGAMLLPIILGADKTTVSVATGHTEYHPLYISPGNLHNDMRRAHRDSVVPLACLAIPKCGS
jgi:hypothetical protein